MSEYLIKFTLFFLTLKEGRYGMKKQYSISVISQYFMRQCGKFIFPLSGMAGLPHGITLYYK